jgi:hypothetical protein
MVEPGKGAGIRAKFRPMPVVGSPSSLSSAFATAARALFFAAEPLYGHAIVI